MKEEKTFICDECKSEVTKVYKSIDNPAKLICESCLEAECEDDGEDD